MLKRCLVFLCLLTAATATTPRPLADMPIPTPDAKKINLKQYRGKVMLVVLFSTSCGDCIKTIGMLDGVQKDFAPRGFQVVAAAIENDASYNVGGFVARYRPSFPVGYLDRESAIKFLDISKDMRPFVPILMFVDGRGTVRFQYFGNDAVMKQGEKAVRAISDGLIRENEQRRAEAKAAAAKAAPKADPQ